MADPPLGGAVDAATLEEARGRLEARFERGIVTREEIERVSAARLRVFDGDDVASEAFRLCCVAWEVDRPEPVTSHRPWIGPVIVFAKKVAARALRFQIEGPLLRQREFNRNLLLVLREILDRTKPR